MNYIKCKDIEEVKYWVNKFGCRPLELKKASGKTIYSDGSETQPFDDILNEDYEITFKQDLISERIFTVEYYNVCSGAHLEKAKLEKDPDRKVMCDVKEWSSWQDAKNYSEEWAKEQKFLGKKLINPILKRTIYNAPYFDCDNIFPIYASPRCEIISEGKWTEHYPIIKFKPNINIITRIIKDIAAISSSSS